MARYVFLLLLIIATIFPSCVRQSGRRKPHNEVPVDTRSSRPARGSAPAKEFKPPQLPPTRSVGSEMSGAAIFEKYNSAVFMVFTSDGVSNHQGSGFFISSSGVAVSNYHVFDGTTVGFENIKLTNGSVYRVKRIIAYNTEDDYIIFEVDAQSDRFNYIPLSGRQPRIGEKAYAIGSPRGLENTFSSGEVSQLRGSNIIQISVPIDNGSSGGALLNSYGEAIGITTAGVSDSGANLNFAININLIKKHL